MWTRQARGPQALGKALWETRHLEELHYRVFPRVQWEAGPSGMTLGRCSVTVTFTSVTFLKFVSKMKVYLEGFLKNLRCFLRQLKRCNLLHGVKWQMEKETKNSLERPTTGRKLNNRFSNASCHQKGHWGPGKGRDLTKVSPRISGTIKFPSSEQVFRTKGHTDPDAKVRKRARQMWSGVIQTWVWILGISCTCEGMEQLALS